MSEHNGHPNHPMDEIAEQFKTSATPKQNQPPSETVTAADSSDDRFKPGGTSGSEPESSPAAQAGFGQLSLSPEQIDAPSFFVDKKLTVVWMNNRSTDSLSLAMARELDSAPTHNIFDLLLRPAIKDSIANWQAFFSFVYILLRRSTDPSTFDRKTVIISKRHLPLSGDKTTPAPATHPFLVDSCAIGRHVAAAELPLRIFGLEFKEGTMFLLREDPWQDAVTMDGPTGSADADIVQRDEKKTICILSSRLNDSHRISDTMLPEVFLKLMHQIWDEGDSVVRSFGGRRAGCSGAQIDYLFTESAGRNPIFSAICCADRMNRQMHALEEGLKAKQGWTNEIRMNMGISHGTDELSNTTPPGFMESTIPGGTFDQSSHLSAIAGKGEIWITRNAVAQLPRKLLDQVVVGIDRQGRFLRNLFTRLSDLPQAAGAGRPQPDLGNLPIARILTIEKPGPAQPVSNEV
jgi:class 3 adenylate cyclase